MVSDWYKALSEEEKKIKREYSRNWYGNMSDEEKQKQKNAWKNSWKNTEKIDPTMSSRKQKNQRWTEECWGVCDNRFHQR